MTAGGGEPGRLPVGVKEGLARLKRRFGSYGAAWDALRERGLSGLSDDDAHEAELRKTFQELGFKPIDFGRSRTVRWGGAVARYWLELAIVAVVVGFGGLLLGGETVRTHRLVAARSLAPFSTFTPGALDSIPVLLRIGGYSSAGQVAGRLTTTHVDSGQVILPSMVSRFRLGDDTGPLSGAGMIVSVPVTGDVEGALTPGRHGSILALLPRDDAAPRGDGAGGQVTEEPPCIVFAGLLVLAMDRTATTTRLTVAVPDSLASGFVRTLATPGHSFRPVLGRPLCAAGG